AEKIADAAQKRRVGRIVLGYPKNMDGTLGPRAEKSEALAALLRNQYKLDVVLWDERRTTADAHRILSEAGVSGKKRRGTVDAVAAALILEGYLNSIR
ncbi:MAG: Holliday junction resolvase RuvX, partial [Clostridiales bacterium]|nr:Holliday junction resolvase RuvX [Clostridiales bacterium]